MLAHLKTIIIHTINWYHIEEVMKNQRRQWGTDLILCKKPQPWDTFSFGCIANYPFVVGWQCWMLISLLSQRCWGYDSCDNVLFWLKQTPLSCGCGFQTQTKCKSLTFCEKMYTVVKNCTFGENNVKVSICVKWILTKVWVKGTT